MARAGSVVAATLANEGVPCIVVEQSLAVTREPRRQGVPAIYGDSGWPEPVRAARVLTPLSLPRPQVEKTSG